MAHLPVSKAIDMEQLQAEMVAAGVNITALGRDESGLFTYDAQGQPKDLPAGAAAVLTAHTPQPREADVAKADLTSQYAAAVDRLDAIIADGGTYTAPQVRDAVVDLARIQKRALRFIKSTST